MKGLVKDYARPNRYWVQFGIPYVMLTNLLTTKMKDIELNCHQAAFPALSIGTSEQRTAGPIRKMPNDLIYTEASLGFYSDSEFNIRNYFDAWIHNTFDQETKNFEYYENYTSYIVIMQYDNAGKIVHGVKLLEAYPTTLSEITLGYDQVDTIETFGVTFTYRNWEKIPGIGGAESFINDLAPSFIDEGAAVNSISSAVNNFF